MFKNYYEILEISESATEEEIKIAFRKLAKKYHPDSNQNTENDEKIKLIIEAYKVLAHEDKRKDYDSKLKFAKNTSDDNTENMYNFYEFDFRNMTMEQQIRFYERSKELDKEIKKTLKKIRKLELKIMLRHIEAKIDNLKFKLEIIKDEIEFKKSLKKCISYEEFMKNYDKTEESSQDTEESKKLILKNN